MKEEILEVQFNKSVEKIKPFLSQIEKEVIDELGDNPVLIRQDLEKTLGYYGWVNPLNSIFVVYEIRAKKIYLPSKEEGTEMERKVILEDKVSLYTFWKNKISQLTKVIEKRLSVGQTIVNSFEQEYSKYDKGVK